MATTQLRLRGVTPAHLVVAAISAAPLGWFVWRAAVHHAVVPLSFVGLAAVAALLPWLSRFAARASYRAKCDDVAVHVRGEALPYKTITNVRVQKNARRKVLVLERGETTTLVLILWDAFAGRLQPYDVLAKKLAEHGKAIPDA
jgi:hypothetical protein